MKEELIYIRELIEKSKYQKVFKLLFNLKVSRDYRNKIKTLKSRFSRIEDDNNLGIVTPIEHRTELTRITSALLTLADSIEDDYSEYNSKQQNRENRVEESITNPRPRSNNAQIVMATVALLTFLFTFVFLLPTCNINQLSTVSKVQDSRKTSGKEIDERDGEEYDWILLKDNLKWMVENINYDTTDSWCYDSLELDCKKYGRLYTWGSAKIACPKNWRLPTDQEWSNMLERYESSQGGLENSDLNEKMNFFAQLGGFLYVDGFSGKGSLGHYWTSDSINDSVNAVYYLFDKKSNGVYRREYKKSQGRSCRCVQPSD